MAYKLPESVLVVLHSSTLEMLLIERVSAPGERGAWQSVTGARADATEPLHQTALREVAEETGLQIALQDLRDWQHSEHYPIAPAWRHRYAPGVTHNIEHVFSACIDRHSPIRLDPQEHRDWQWLPAAEAADRVFSRTNAAAIRRLMAERT
ncbi:MAG TPA: dihydroneopterin triphosphate diphosphatase [Burkholderiaceae bacterium]|nr:dihydroneopterin triphosphate diphosphatase [Burkholderiaceae bacterium]